MRAWVREDRGREGAPTLSEVFWRSLWEPGTGLPTRLGPLESRDGCFLLARLWHGPRTWLARSRCPLGRRWLRLDLGP